MADKRPRGLRSVSTLRSLEMVRLMQVSPARIPAVANCIAELRKTDKNRRKDCKLVHRAYLCVELVWSVPMRYQQPKVQDCVLRIEVSGPR
jgi:hypothetical protein